MTSKNNKGAIGPDQVDLGKHKLEASYIVSVSTCHVTKKDCELIDSMRGARAEELPQYILYKPDLGYLISVWHWQMDEDDGKAIEAKLLELGFSECYVHICRTLALAGAKYLDLDQDGQDYDFLVEFAW